VLFLRLRFPYAGNQIVERECVLSSRVRVRLPLVCAGNRIVGRGCLLLPRCDSGFREFVPETELSRGNGCFFPGAPTPVSVSLCRKANSRREWVLGMVPRVLVVPSRMPLIIRGRWLGMVRFSGCDSFVSPSFDISVSSGPFSTSSVSFVISFRLFYHMFFTFATFLPSRLVLCPLPPYVH
jgi:hypothetical protein